MPDDSDIENMDPMLRTYMQFHWIEDKSEFIDILQQHGNLIGSWSNPELASKVLGGNQYATSDEEFEETSRQVLEASKKQSVVKSKRRRRKTVRGN